MKKRAKIGAWLLAITMLSSVIPTQMVWADQSQMTSVEIEEELNRQLEQVYDEVLQQADEYQNELLEQAEIQVEQPIVEEIQPGASGLTEELLNNPEAYRQWKEGIIAESNISDRTTEGMIRLQRANPVVNNIMSNQYIGISVNSIGRINMGTTGGDPAYSTDNNKYLLYAYPGGQTSFTTIRIDNKDYVFQAQGGVKFAADGTSAESTMTIGDIIIKQIIKFEFNANTGREDMGKISYEVINTGTTLHDVGIRMMFDTMLGSNDGVPFKVPGYGNVTTEIEIQGGDIPQYWQAFDSFQNPSVISNGTFYRNIYEKPDKVQFCHWGRITATLWDMAVIPGYPLTSDSAVAVYFNPETISPGASRNVETYYGIGNLRGSLAPEGVSYSLTAPSSLQANTQTGNYDNNPFTITGYVYNNSDSLAKDVKMTLSLPAELQPVGGTKGVNYIGTMQPREERLINYQILALSQTEEKNLEYKIKLEANGQAVQEGVFSVNLPKVTGVQAGDLVINYPALSMTVGESKLLAVTSNTVGGAVTWVSDQPGIATVNRNGWVSAKAPGYANITASMGGRKVTCQVTVTGNTVWTTGIEFLPNNINLAIDETKNLNVIFTPGDATFKRIKAWTSSNPSVVTVARGKITGLSKGEAVITAKSQDGNYIASCTVKVAEAEPVVDMGPGVDFEAEASGPNASMESSSSGDKYQFPLFTLPIGVKLDFGKHVKLVYDDFEDKYVASFGDIEDPPNTQDTNPDGTLTDEAKQLRKQSYQNVKALMNKVGKQTNQQFYNDYRKLVSKKSPFSIEGDKAIFGYFELVKVKNGTDYGYALSEGELCVLFSAGLQAKYPFPAVPAAYMRFKIEGSLQGGFNIKLVEAGNLSKGIDLTGKGEAVFKATAGIGADIFIAELEGGLEGELKSTLKLGARLEPAASPVVDLEMKLRANVYVSYEALFFFTGKKTWKIADFQLYPGAQRSSYEPPMIQLSEKDLVPIPRDYADQASVFTANSRTRALSTDTVLQSNTVKTNVYPYAAPQMTSFDNGDKLLTWIDNDPARMVAQNSMALYYSYYDGSVWSAPRQVENDGTADFKPAVVSSGNKAYLTWQNAEKAYEAGVIPSEAASSIGISGAVFENGSFRVQDITTPDQKLDYEPVIATDGGKVGIVWLNNDANDLFGLSGKNILYRSSYEEGIFGKPEALSNDLGMVGQLEVGYYKGDTLVAYSKDLDNNMNTPQDREVFTIFGTAGPRNMTNNQTVDSSPVIINANGITELYWYGEGIMYYMPDFAKGELVPTATSNYIHSQFDVVSNGNERGIIWEESKGFTSDLYGMFYDNQTNTWGNPVQLTAQNSRIRHTTSLMNPDGTIELIYVSAQVLDNPEEEVDPMGQCDLVSSKLVKGCDLKLGDGISFDREQVYRGSTLDLGVYVENAGQQPINGIHATIYNNNQAVGAVDIDVKLPTGTGQFIDIPYTLGDSLTAHEVRLELVPKGQIDYNMTNNTLKTMIGESVIVVKEMKVSGQGNTRLIKAKIYNQGYADTGALTVEVAKQYEGAEKPTQIVAKTMSVENIPAQGSLEVEFEIPISSTDFTKESAQGLLTYVKVVNPTTREVIAKNYIQIQNPYYNDQFTLSSLNVAGNTIVFNIDNNLPEKKQGLLCIEHMVNGEGEVVYGQAIELDGFEGDLMQLDLTAIQMEGGSLDLYVEDEEGNIISNQIGTDADNVVRARKPVASPIPGIYRGGQTISFYAPNEGAQIYYTVNGSEPTARSMLYVEPIKVEETTTVRAIAVHPELFDSEVGVYPYIILPKQEKVAMPTASVESGIYKKVQQVTLDCATPGVSIYYTTDGSIPTKESLVYSHPITVRKSTVIKAVAVKEDMIPSDTALYTYIIELEKDIDYAIFASDSDNAFILDTQSGEIKGNLYSNGNMVFMTGKYQVDSKVKTVGKVIKKAKEVIIETLEENADSLETTNHMPNLLAKIQGQGTVYPKAKTLSSGIMTINQPIRGLDMLTIMGSTVDLGDFVIAKNNIFINASQMKNVSGKYGIIASEYGNIHINASELNLEGIIYAPNGTVTIEGSVANFKGKIIAEKVVIRTSQLSIQDDGKVVDLLK